MGICEGWRDRQRGEERKVEEGKARVIYVIQWVKCWRKRGGGRFALCCKSEKDVQVVSVPFTSSFLRPHLV